MVFAVAFLSLLDLTEKKRDAVNGGWHVESAASAVAHPDERAKMVALVKETMIAMDDGGCVWMALIAPSVALLVAVVAESAAAGGF